MVHVPIIKLELPELKTCHDLKLLDIYENIPQNEFQFIESDTFFTKGNTPLFFLETSFFFSRFPLFWNNFASF